MNKQLKVPAALCKQVGLQLAQAGSDAEVTLAGDCLLQECLLLLSPLAFEAGDLASLQVQFFGQTFAVQGLVKSCLPRQGGVWLLTYKLKNADNLQTRMLLQLSRMEQYRNEMAIKGRLLSIDEAACEWISLYAAEFAAEFDSAADKKEAKNG